jgi:hypothetical protein
MAVLTPNLNRAKVPIATLEVSGDYDVAVAWQGRNLCFLGVCLTRLGQCRNSNPAERSDVTLQISHHQP